MNAYLWVYPWPTEDDTEPALHAIARWKYTDLAITWLTTECGDFRFRTEDVLLVEDAKGRTRLTIPGPLGQATTPPEKCAECKWRMSLKLRAVKPGSLI